MEIAEILIWEFCAFIKDWLALVFLPFAAVIHVIPLNSMPFLFAALRIVTHQYFLIFLPPVLYAAYDSNYLPSSPKQIIKYLLATPFILLIAPYALLFGSLIVITPIAHPAIAAGLVLNTLFSFKVFSSIFHLFKPGSDWHIKNTFKNPLSDESFLFAFIALGICFSLKTPIPFLVFSATLFAGYLYMGEKIEFHPSLNDDNINRTHTVQRTPSPSFRPIQPAVRPASQLQRLQQTNPLEQLRQQSLFPNFIRGPVWHPPRELPQQHRPVSRIPQLSEQQRLAVPNHQANFVTSLNLEQEIIRRQTISPFQKVLDLLKDSENDYLLTENNNFYLRDAAEKNNWELVARLLKKPNVAAQAHYGDWLVLRLAIQHHQWKIVSKFLTLPIISQTPMSIGKNDVFNRLVHQVTVQKQSNIITEIIHSQIYELFNSKTKLNFLLFSIKDNLYPNIIKILNDRGFLDHLEPDDFNSIFEDISKNVLQKISTQCDFFLAYIKEKYINAPIAINHISIDHLINIDCFDSLESVALFYKDPYVFLRTKTNNKLHAINAMELLDYKNTYFKLRDSSREAKESAQQASEVIAANQLFETVKNHYKETFDSKKTIEYSSVEAIEREIKTYLLEQIFSEANESVKKLQDLTPSTKIINIIDTQKEALLSGDVEAHIALIKVLNKHFVPNNVSAAQTAWLSYSAMHNIDENGWKFLVQPTEEHVVHSTAESTQTDEAMTNTMASSIVRERIAYYWLAVTDEAYPDLDNFRLGNFVGAISTIYKTYGFGQSCCYPGHLTGIAQMGLNHPIAEPITLENLLDQAVISHIIETVKDTLSDHPEWSAEDKENFLTSITYINERNADEMFHAEEAPPIDMNVCDKFNKLVMHFSDEVIDEVMNHQRYKNRNISKEEQTLIKAGIQYKLANMASNQYILSALNEVILASRCIKKDINLEEASPYVPNTPKHKLYLELAKELNAKLLSLPDEKLPSIVDLNKIGGEISKKIIDGIVSDNNPTNALDELKNYGISINIEPIRRSHLMHRVEFSVLPQFNYQRINNSNQNATSTHTINKTTVLTKKMFG